MSDETMNLTHSSLVDVEWIGVYSADDTPYVNELLSKDHRLLNTYVRDEGNEERGRRERLYFVVGRLRKSPDGTGWDAVRNFANRDANAPLFPELADITPPNSPAVPEASESHA